MLVRFFDQPSLNNRLRITVGAPEENDALLAALDAALAQDSEAKPHPPRVSRRSEAEPR